MSLFNEPHPRNQLTHKIQKDCQDMKKIITAMLMTGISGCTLHWTDIDLKPNGADAVANHSSHNNVPGCLAIMTDMKVKSNGQETNPSSEFQKRFMAHIKDTKIFDSVVHDMPTIKPDKYVSFALESDENQDTNQGANYAKGFFIGATFFLFTPVIPLSYDFESDMHLTATRGDGKTKQYNAKGKGSASYQLYANAAMAGQEIRAEVTNNNINSLINQLALDANFLCGS